MKRRKPFSRIDENQLRERRFSEGSLSNGPASTSTGSSSMTLDDQAFNFLTSKKPAHPVNKKPPKGTVPFSQKKTPKMTNCASQRPERRSHPSGFTSLETTDDGDNPAEVPQGKQMAATAPLTCASLKSAPSTQEGATRTADPKPSRPPLLAPKKDGSHARVMTAPIHRRDSVQEATKRQIHAKNAPSVATLSASVGDHRSALHYHSSPSASFLLETIPEEDPQSLERTMSPPPKGPAQTSTVVHTSKMPDTPPVEALSFDHAKAANEVPTLGQQSAAPVSRITRCAQESSVGALPNSNNTSTRGSDQLDPRQTNRQESNDQSSDMEIASDDQSLLSSSSDSTCAPDSDEAFETPTVVQTKRLPQVEPHTALALPNMPNPSPRDPVDIILSTDHVPNQSSRTTKSIKGDYSDLLPLKAPLSSELLRRFCKSSPDNAAAVKAMFESTTHEEVARFPLVGTTVEVHPNAADLASVDGSEVTFAELLDAKARHAKSTKSNDRAPATTSALADEQRSVASTYTSAQENASQEKDDHKEGDDPSEQNSRASNPPIGESPLGHDSFVDSTPAAVNPLEKKPSFEKQSSPELWTAAVAGIVHKAPVFTLPNGKRYRHAPLPSGWSLRVSRSKNRPYYVHPDFGNTFHAPIFLPDPNMRRWPFLKDHPTGIESLTIGQDFATPPTGDIFDTPVMASSFSLDDDTTSTETGPECKTTPRSPAMFTCNPDFSELAEISRKPGEEASQIQPDTPSKVSLASEKASVNRMETIKQQSKGATDALITVRCAQTPMLLVPPLLSAQDPLLSSGTLRAVDEVADSTLAKQGASPADSRAAQSSRKETPNLSFNLDPVRNEHETPEANYHAGPLDSPSSGETVTVCINEVHDKKFLTPPGIENTSIATHAMRLHQLHSSDRDFNQSDNASSDPTSSGSASNSTTCTSSPAQDIFTSEGFERIKANFETPQVDQLTIEKADSTASPFISSIVESPIAHDEISSLGGEGVSILGNEDHDIESIASRSPRTTLSIESFMSHRVLHPALPLCSLQNLGKLALQCKYSKMPPKYSKMGQRLSCNQSKKRKRTWSKKGKTAKQNS